MAARVTTVAFMGIEAVPVDVQVQVSPGMPKFNVVGLADKAVGESRERVRAALIASGLALPAKHITVNLAPADLPKEGSHYDLPIALGLMAAMGAIPGDMLEKFIILGELALDGRVSHVEGVLPAAIAANARDMGSSAPPDAVPKPPGRAKRSISSPSTPCSRWSIIFPGARSLPGPNPSRRFPIRPGPIFPICAGTIF